MHAITYVAFKDELEKISSLAEHALDVGGLAMLAAPTVSKHFRNKEWSEKNKRRIELGGLGVLAAHPAYSIGKRLLTKKGSISGGALSIFKEASEKTVLSSIEKEAFLSRLFGKAKPAFKPSFGGHLNAFGAGADVAKKGATYGVGTNVAKSGVRTTQAFDPLTRTMSRSRSISIPGLTNP